MVASPLNDRRRGPRRSTAMTTTMKPRSTRTTRRAHTHTRQAHFSRITPHSVSSQGCDPQAQGPICWLRGSAAGSVSQHLTGTGAQPPLILLSGTGAHLSQLGPLGAQGLCARNLATVGLEPAIFDCWSRRHIHPRTHTHTHTHTLCKMPISLSFSAKQFRLSNEAELSSQAAKLKY